MPNNAWPAQTFHLENKEGEKEDLPKLLRRVADQIEEEKIEYSDILDVVVRSEIIPDGNSWSVRVYWGT